MRKLLIVPFLGFVMATPAEARKVAAQPAPVIRAIRSDTVIVGKVSAIEKDPVEVAAPGETVKQSFRVAVIKTDAILSGASELTHVKVGFIQPPAVDPTKPVSPRRGYPPVVLTEGQTGVFFLLKHPTAPFFVISPMMPPLDKEAAGYTTELETVKRATSVLADPTKHLKAEKAEDRFFAAAVMIVKYRSYPEGAADVDQLKVSAEESRLILKGLADAPDWARPTGFPISATQLMNYLALTDKDGWKNPMLRPGVPEDVNRLFKDAFASWIEGPGKEYRITKMVAKK